MNSRRRMTPWWLVAPIVLGACVQIVGIEDPRPLDDTSSGGSSGSSSDSSSGSSGGSSGGPGGPWVGWHMPNPASAGLPNPSKYDVDATNDVVSDQVTGLMWQRTTDGSLYTWEQAKSYCQDLVLAGHDDWRLPWRIELVSLVDYLVFGSAIDSTFPNTPNYGFWTASTYATVPGYAWVVEFYEGDTYPDSTSSTTYARCVR